MRVKLEISYIGTNYNGWQSQDDLPTIQKCLQDAVYSLTGEKVKVYASGRTDAGVHAIKQVAHFDTNYKIDATKISFALNQFLPPDIKVVKSSICKDNFNARFDVKKKTYLYKFYFSKIELPLDYERAYQIPFDYDKTKMIDCAKLFVGTYDFTPFSKKGKEEKDRVRTIYSCKLNELENEHFELQICGNGFLHNMVRIITGTIVDVGLGKVSLEMVKDLLKNPNLSRSFAGRTLPPYGLYLKDVEY